MKVKPKEEVVSVVGCRGMPTQRGPRTGQARNIRIWEIIIFWLMSKVRWTHT